MVQQHLSAADVLISHAAVPSLLTDPASLHFDQRDMQLSSAYANSLLTVLLRFSPHTVLTILRTLSHISFYHFVFLYRIVVVAGLGGTSLHPRICSLQSQISKPCLHVLLLNLLAISTARDKVILLNGRTSPSSLPRPSLASRGFHFRP